MQSQSRVPRSSSIGLRALITLIFAVILVVVVGGLVWVTYRGMAALSTVEASTRFDALASTVSQRMRMSFDPGLIMLDTIAAMPLGRMEPFVAAKIVLGVMRSGERRSPAVTAVQIGRPDGSAIIVVRLDEAQRLKGGEYAAKIVEAGSRGLVQTIIRFSADGHELSRADAVPSDFDARNRPWYGAARETDEAITTRPYRYIGQGNVVGVTVAKRSATEDGIVFGIDITIKRLSETLNALRTSPDTDLFLFHPSGQLVARTGERDDSIPSEPSLIDGLPSIAASQDVLLMALYRRYQQNGAGNSFGRNLDIDVGGRHHFVRFEGTRPDTGLIAAISTPRDVVLGPAAALRQEQLLIGLGALLFAALISLVAAQRLAQPLAAVTRVLSGISEFRFDVPRGRPSSIREIDDLWSMVELLEYTLRIFACYVPAHLVRDIARDRRLPMVGGVRQEVTVLFTDVEGFTALSERADPEELMRQISRYFGTIAAVVTASGGVVDKYIGDSVMAVWSGSSESPNHAAQACAATLEIATRINQLNKAFQREGKPLLKTRYGLNTGEGIVGHVGSVDRLSYTVLGHTVNLASRLEQQNKAFGTTILVSEAVMTAAGLRFDFSPVGRVSIRGISSDIALFEPRGCLE